MSLLIEHMKGQVRIHDFVGLSEALSNLIDGANEFWLSHGVDRFPVLAILINGELATLSYFPEEGHPGFKSISNLKESLPNEFSEFFVNTPSESQLVMNEFVTTKKTALKVAEAFRLSSVLPSVIDWQEL